MMQKRKTIWNRIVIWLLVISILLPLILLGVWVFTERWAWPDIIPQVFSTRAIREVWGRKEQLFQVFFFQYLYFILGWTSCSNDWTYDIKGTSLL